MLDREQIIRVARLALLFVLVASCSRSAPQVPTSTGAFLVDLGDNKVMLQINAHNGLRATVRGTRSSELPAPAIKVVTEGCGELEFHPSFGGGGVLAGSDRYSCFNCNQVGAGGQNKSTACPLSQVAGQTLWVWVNE